jgi:hypothetical protein
MRISKEYSIDQMKIKSEWLLRPLIREVVRVTPERKTIKENEI